MQNRTPLLGDVPLLSDLFDDLRYCRNVIVKGHGSHTIHPQCHYFLNPGNGLAWRDHKWVLYAKPKYHVVAAARKYCVANGLSSFEIVRWTDKALVLGRDTHQIGTPWIAFIPLSEIPSPEFLKSLPLID